MSLTDLRRGQWADVEQIAGDGLRLQLLRFGITPGCRVRCHTRGLGGPVVVQYGGREIAVGHRAGGALFRQALTDKRRRRAGAETPLCGWEGVGRRHSASAHDFRRA